jgi:hypothetical protein
VPRFPGLQGTKLLQSIDRLLVVTSPQRAGRKRFENRHQTEIFVQLPGYVR